MTEGLRKGEMMALGAVQSGYAGADYAYRKTTTVTEEFHGSISSAVQAAEDQNGSRVIGVTMLPYGGANESYGMRAQYAAESTPDDPVIQVTSNYGGEWVSYKVNVKEIDPRNASQLEMFALLSYSDDQGISDGGSFGSYQRMKTYADNAQINGYWEGNEDLNSFLNAKHDWIAIVDQMTDDYSKAGVYSQYLNGSKLSATLSHFSLQHVDFDNLQIKDGSADMFSHYELNVPQDVMKAWLETAGEIEMDNDMFSHMTSAMIRRFSKYQDGNTALNPIEAALKAAREALNDLGHSLTSELAAISGIQKELQEESEFYRSFIGKLENLQEAQSTKTTGKAKDAEEETDGEETNDLMQLIREHMEEMIEKIKNGDVETSFQIGNSSFTIKEWEEFLEKFDAMEDAIKELMREEFEKRAEKAENIDALVSESTKCTYPSSVPGQEDTMYITWYTQEGIFCRKAGQSEGYEWSIEFADKEEFQKVMEFLNKFDREDNLRFAAHENFWQDFLKDEIDIESFMKFYEGTDHGVPNYAITIGDSMYVDRDKIQWAKYMNSPGNRLYTQEEIMKMQEELIEANKAKLTKLSDPFSRQNMFDWRYLAKRI